MKTLFNQFTEDFDVLSENEMSKLKGGLSPKPKDVFDPDEQ